MNDLWELPTSWRWTPIGDATDVIGGGTPSTTNPKNFEGSIPWITPADMSGYLGKTIAGGARFISEQGLADSGARWLPQGAVLFSSRAPIGYVAVASRPVTTNQGLKSFVPGNGLNSDYLYYWLTSAKQHAEALASGTTFLELTGAKAALIPLPLAPNAEQTRIVEKLEELLSDLDAGVAELKAAQKKLGQFRQSLLKAAVEGALTAEWRAARKVGAGDTAHETGAQLLERILTERRVRWEAKQRAKFAEQGKAPPKDWQKKYPEPVQSDTTGLPELPEGWVWASVDQLSESVRNGISKTPNTDGRGFPIFKINAVRPMVVSFTAIKHIELYETEAADYWVEVGDVLATRYNGSVDLLGVFGMVKAVPQRTLHPDKLIRMKPLLGGQLGAWLEVCGNVGVSRSHLVSRVKTTAGQTGISGEDLKKTPIPLPPFVEQQAALTGLEALLHAIEELETPTELGLKQSAAQRKNILKAAFSGQLGVKQI